MSPALPSPDLQLTWRPLTAGDTGDLYALLRRIEEHDDPPYRSTREEVADTALSHWTDLAANSLAGFDASGVLRAYGVLIEAEARRSAPRTLLEGGVDPEVRHRGVGSGLLTWQLQRAKELLADAQEPGRVVVHVEEGMSASADLVQRHGFVPGGFHTEMRRDLTTLDLPEVELAHPLELIAWSPELDDAVRIAHGEAFGNGMIPPTPERWQEGRTYFVPEWSFLVLDRTSDRAQVAGYLLSSRYEQDWPTLGWSEGYVDILGVRAPWRGRRIATALLVRAMRAYKESGMEYAALGLDHADEQDSFGLFDRLAFTPTRGSTTYVLQV
ncbi:MAG TPA: GNAT family N-acetyltransferase [Ruania sp.]|nr:GNAT family N-acetyltransferase [Ruania sp.]